MLRKPEPESLINGVSRRAFFAAAAAGAVSGSARAATPPGAQHELLQRQHEAYRIRVDAAQFERDAPQPDHPNNGDEQNYPNFIGNFSKGLPHNGRGEVDPIAYAALLAAMDTGRQSDIETVPMGSTDPARQMKFVNPCSGACFDLQGADSHHLQIPAAPSVASAEAAGEMVELYWHALTRDVPFTEYDSNALVQAAAADLSKVSVFRGPKANGKVTSSTLFRGFTAGDTVGPYISQFLLKPLQFGVQYIPQQIRTVLPGSDWATQFSDWLNLQNGITPTVAVPYDSQRRFIRNGRDMGMWVHIDVLFQGYFNAMLMLSQPPDATDTLTGGGMGAPLNPGNPYVKSKNQTGFGTFGMPAVAAAVAEIATRALKAVWYQKWFVHRRLRPEEYGGLVHVATTDRSVKYPIHPDVLNSAALAKVQSLNGTGLLPLAFPEGCPIHPSYGAGHATVAGASVTILKALFDESYPFPNPMVPSTDGLTLVPYTGADAAQMTVGSELNKLASNIAIGRNFAGVHWRSDYVESLKLGEAVAISVLRDQRATYAEDFEGYTFHRFDGSAVTV